MNEFISKVYSTRVVWKWYTLCLLVTNTRYSFLL